MTNVKTQGVSVQRASSHAIGSFVTALPFGFDLPIGDAVAACLNLFF